MRFKRAFLGYILLSFVIVMNKPVTLFSIDYTKCPKSLDT